MRYLRRHLSRFVGVWLACQVLALLVAPAFLASAGIAADELCTCPGGTPGQTCPMHGGPHREADDDSHCVIRSASTHPEAMLSVFGSVGMLPADVAIHYDVGIAAVAPSAAPHLRFRPELPDSPPPRR
jgi:hypothetical protein